MPTTSSVSGASDLRNSVTTMSSDALPCVCDEGSAMTTVRLRSPVPCQFLLAADVPVGVVRTPLTSTMTAATLAEDRDAASRTVMYVLGTERPWMSADPDWQHGLKNWEKYWQNLNSGFPGNKFKLESATHLNLKTAVQRLDVCTAPRRRLLRLAELCLAHAKCVRLCLRPTLLTTRGHMAPFLIVDTGLLLLHLSRRTW